MTSGFNIATNITNYSMFNAMTALTHTEVKTLIKEVDIESREEIFNTMLVNYDGYKFSYNASELVFNPTLVMYYLFNYLEDGTEPIDLMDSNILSNYRQIENIIKINNNNYYNDILLEVINNTKVSSSLKVNFDLNIKFSREYIISMLYYF